MAPVTGLTLTYPCVDTCAPTEGRPAASAHHRIGSSLAADADTAPLAIDLQSAYASAPIGLGCVDRDLRYVYINDRLAEYHGRPAAEHIGRTLREMTTPAVADQLERVYRHVLVTGEPVLDFELSSTDPAAKHTCIGSYTPVRDDRGAVVGVNAVVGRTSHIAACTLPRSKR